MSVTITFVSHSTSLDNKAGIASGHFDVALSAPGHEQAERLGETLAGRQFDAVYSSDMQRASETARIAFGDRGFPLLEDARLRECDYRELTRAPRETVGAARPNCIDRPFPDGESYNDVTARVRAFLDQVAAERDGQAVVMVGHRATHDCLVHLATGMPLADTIARDWEWQPG
jgi:broad specificity phosphatase PhoE